MKTGNTLRCKHKGNQDHKVLEIDLNPKAENVRWWLKTVHINEAN